MAFPRMPPSPGTLAALREPLIVERYAVYDEFAAGGMASVHFARLNGAHGFRRTVAVKRLLPRLAHDRDLALMLVDEARLASRVRHHNVVSLLDVVKTADELLLVMEYVHGESLAKLLRWSSERGEPIPLAIGVAIVVDALHGLHAAHEATDEQGVALGLVHRDVSPQNILVGLDGITRIADFGVAKAAGRVLSTRDGAVKGKLAYMAPEQIGGGEVSRLSDVFAMAVVLWEVLVGACLFAAENEAERVFKVMAAPIPRPSTRRAELPAALDAIVLRGLERDPSRRYGSAREMALALEGAAPSVRASEIASWVERVVAGRLSERIRMLSAIERDEDGEADAVTARRERVAPSEPWDAAVSLHTLHETATGTGRARALWQRGSDERAPSVPSVSSRTGSVSLPRNAKATGRPVLFGGSVLVLLALLGVIAWTVSWPWRRSPAPVPAPASQAVKAVTAEQGASFEAPSAVPLSLPPPTTTPVAPAKPASSTLEPSAPTKSKLGAAPANEKRRLRPTRKNAAPACDPPYSIDPAGRVLFKVECM